MKAVATTAGALALLALAGSAQAIDGGVNVGEDYTHVRVGLGTNSPGFALSGDWLRSDHDGNVESLSGLQRRRWRCVPLPWRESDVHKPY